jgi:hypothetical protein
MSVIKVAYLEREKHQVGLAVLLGFFFGVIGGGIGQYGLALVGTAVLASLFGAYNHTLKHNNGLSGGMLAGGLLGLFVSVVSLPISHNIGGIFDGALFGCVSGIVIGGIIGVITHAQPDKGDKLFTKIFLFWGSIGLGALLGGGVGLTSGAILGLIGNSWQGIAVAALSGGIVGGYIGSYYQKLGTILWGACALALIAALSSWIDGALAGLVLGLISGTFAPMFIVALIGAYGGLFGRGLKAMVVEAAEAPAEMLRQGAVPFLVPAMMVGMMVGTAASGVGSVILLPVSLAVIGLMLAVFGELEGKPDNQVTIRTIVEMTMMGADDWPIYQVIRHITGRNRKKAAAGVAFYLFIGVTSSVAGIYLGVWLRQLLTGVLVSS